VSRQERASSRVLPGDKRPATQFHFSREA